jgi:hypothetical protein
MEGDEMTDAIDIKEVVISLPKGKELRLTLEEVQALRLALDRVCEKVTVWPILYVPRPPWTPTYPTYPWTITHSDGTSWIDVAGNKSEVTK